MKIQFIIYQETPESSFIPQWRIIPKLKIFQFMFDWIGFSDTLYTGEPLPNTKISFSTAAKAQAFLDNVGNPREYEKRIRREWKEKCYKIISSEVKEF